MGKTISQITQTASSINNNDLVEIEQSGVSKKSTVSNLLSNEATARQSADTTLTNNLNLEILNRQNADVALATAIAQRVQINGTTPFAGDQSMGGFKLTSVADAVANTDAINLQTLKKKGVWDISSNAKLLNIDASTTIVAATDGNLIYLNGSTVTASRVINLTSTANDNRNFRVVHQGFLVASGATLTIQINGGNSKVFREGFHNPSILDISYNSSLLLGTSLNETFSDISFLGLDIKSPRHAVYYGYYDFSTVGGAIGSVNVKSFAGTDLVLPEGSIILHKDVVIETQNPLVSGGAAQIAWGYTGSTSAFDAATAYSSAPYNASNLVKSGSVTTVNKLTSSKQVLMTISGAALTDGRILIHIPVILNKF